MTMLLDRRSFATAGLAAAFASVLPRPLAARASKRHPSVEALIGRFIAERKFPGAVAAIGRSTRAPDFVNGGTLAFNGKAAADENSLWRIYSMTKPVTGMAAMMLIHEGQIALDQPVADFVPGFARMRVLTDPAASLESVPAKAPVTVRHLLTHTGGFGYTIMLKGPLLKEYERLGLQAFVASRQPMPGTQPAAHAPSLKDFADRLATLPLLSEPGTRWNYSVGLDLLGRVIEVAAGVPFDTFLKQRLFDPLGMTSTGFQVAVDDAPRLATNYLHVGPLPLPIDLGAQSAFLDPPPYPMGGAGLVSSARDYDRFLAMLAGEGTLDGRSVMAPEAVRMGMSNLLPTGAGTAGTLVAGQGFGAGGRVTTSGPAAGSYGWAGAAGTVGWVDPVRGLRGAAYANYMPADSIPWQADATLAIYRDSL